MNRISMAAFVAALFIVVPAYGQAPAPGTCSTVGTVTICNPATPAAPSPVNVTLRGLPTGPEVNSRLDRIAEGIEALKPNPGASAAASAAKAKADNDARVIESQEETKRVQAQEETKRAAVKAAQESKGTDTRAVFGIPQANEAPQQPEARLSPDEVRVIGGTTLGCRNRSVYRATNKNGAVYAEDCRDWLMPPPAPVPPPDVNKGGSKLGMGIGLGLIVVGAGLGVYAIGKDDPFQNEGYVLAAALGATAGGVGMVAYSWK